MPSWQISSGSDDVVRAGTPARGGSSVMQIAEPRTDRLDHRGPVLAVAAWAGAWPGISGDQRWVWLAVVVGGLLLGWGVRARRRLALTAGVVLLSCLAVAGGRSLAAHSGPVSELADEGAVVAATLRTGPGRLATGGFGGPTWFVPARLEQVAGRDQHWLTGQSILLRASGDVVGSWIAVVPGSVVTTTLRFSPAEKDEPYTATARAREPAKVMTSPGWLDAGVHRVRSVLHESVAGLAEEPRAVVPALVVGDTSAMSPQLTDRFRVTGLAHLAAVSGSNLTLLLASLLWLAGRFGVRGWWLRGLAVTGVAGFVVLCHGEPSVVRAAAMGSVGLAALGFGGRQRGLRQLSWAVIGLLLIDPWLASSAGFALSVTASVGIICWARAWTDALAGWMPRGLAEAIAVPISAQLATQPIIVAISGQLSLVGVLANLVAGPLVGPTTILGFACAAVGPLLPAAAMVFGWLAGWGAQALCWIANLGAALPAAAIPWPATPVGIMVLIGLSAASFLLGGRLLRRRWLALAAAALLIVVLLRPVSAPGWPPIGWEAVQCDVGQGSATVVAVSPREAIVVDTGPDPPALERCLSVLGVHRVPLLILTHFHADHVGGLAALAGREVDAVLAPSGHAGAEQVNRLLPDAEAIAAVPGMILRVGEVRVTVLSALAPSAFSGAAGEESSAENDGSVVSRIETRRLVVMATGDIELSGQAAVLRSGFSLTADVLVVPHHGSARQTPELFGAVAAPVALIGVGENTYGHPSATALRELARAGSAVFRTDTQGSLAVTPTDIGLQVTTERPG
ncbi:MAG: ComEC/Rec2 family competence protein [Propionibacteriaceae bacterium]|nr:ComEC/Rec2 family competence protein [Propionibacteriaceae bacterium]